MIIGKYIIAPSKVVGGSILYDSQAERYCVTFITEDGDLFYQYVVEKDKAEKMSIKIDECVCIHDEFESRKIDAE